MPTIFDLGGSGSAAVAFSLDDSLDAFGYTSTVCESDSRSVEYSSPSGWSRSKSCSLWGLFDLLGLEVHRTTGDDRLRDKSSLVRAAGWEGDSATSRSETTWPRFSSAPASC